MKQPAILNNGEIAGSSASNFFTLMRIEDFAPFIRFPIPAHRSFHFDFLLLASGSMQRTYARVAALLALGLSRGAIAEQIRVKPATVSHYRHEIFKKLGVASIGELRQKRGMNAPMERSH